MTARDTNLTPTVITDRNGKVTTVHKRLNERSKTAKALPSPTTQKLASSSSSLERVLTILSSPHLPYRSRNLESAKKIHALLANKESGEVDVTGQSLIVRLKDHQADAVLEALATQEDFASIITAMHGSYSVGQIAGFASVYEPDLFVPPSRADASDEEKRTLNMRLFGTGYALLKRNQLLGPRSDIYDDLTRSDIYDDLSSQDAEGRKLVQSFFMLWSVIDEIGRTKMPPELVDFSMQGDHDIKAVVAAIRATGSVDPVVIRGVINGMESSVAEGWL